MQVFELTEVQADYILEMPLRRLTQFSRIELEGERDELRRPHRGAHRDPLRRARCCDDGVRRARRRRQGARHAPAHGAARVGRRRRRPRRGAARGRRRAVRGPALVAPGCSRGRPTPTSCPQAVTAAAHDVVVSAVLATARGEVGLLTSRRSHACGSTCSSCPVLPSTQRLTHPGRRGAARGDHRPDAGRAGASLSLRCPAGSRARPGHRAGRGQAGRARRARDAGHLERDPPGGRRHRRRRRRAADRAGGPGVHQAATRTCCASRASAVRPQGRAAGGVAGIRLGSGQRAVFFGAVDPARDGLVVTAATARQRCRGCPAAQ